MSDAQYRIILKGYLAGKGEYYIEEAFAKLFKISHAQATEYFKQRPKVLTEGLNQQQADQYILATKNIGADCEAEDMRYNVDHLSMDME